MYWFFGSVYLFSDVGVGGCSDSRACFLDRERHAKCPEDTLSNPRCRDKTVFRHCVCSIDALDARAQLTVFECFVCRLSALEFAFPFVTLYPAIMMASFRLDDGGLTFDGACGQVGGMKLQGPEHRPLRSDRTVGAVDIGDLPVRQLDSSSTRIEQFADTLMYHPLEVTG